MYGGVPRKAKVNRPDCSGWRVMRPFLIPLFSLFYFLSHWILSLSFSFTFNNRALTSCWCPFLFFFLSSSSSGVQLTTTPPPLQLLPPPLSSTVPASKHIAALPSWANTLPRPHQLRLTPPTALNFLQHKSSVGNLCTTALDSSRHLAVLRLSSVFSVDAQRSTIVSSHPLASFCLLSFVARSLITFGRRLERKKASFPLSYYPTTFTNCASSSDFVPHSLCIRIKNSILCLCVIWRRHYLASWRRWFQCAQDCLCVMILESAHISDDRQLSRCPSAAPPYRPHNYHHHHYHQHLPFLTISSQKCPYGVGEPASSAASLATLTFMWIPALETFVHIDQPPANYPLNVSSSTEYYTGLIDVIVWL